MKILILLLINFSLFAQTATPPTQLKTAPAPASASKDNTKLYGQVSGTNALVPVELGDNLSLEYVNGKLIIRAIIPVPPPVPPETRVLPASIKAGTSDTIIVDSPPENAANRVALVFWNGILQKEGFDYVRNGAGEFKNNFNFTYDQSDVFLVIYLGK